MRRNPPPRIPRRRARSDARVGARIPPQKSAPRPLMDIATVLGYVLGIGLLLWSMPHAGGIAALKLFVHPPAAAVVGAARLAGILVPLPLSGWNDCVKV